MIDRIVHLFVVGWRSAFEIVLLTVVIYYGYLYFRGTRGAKVLTGLAIVFLALTLISTLLKLAVIGWIDRSLGLRHRAGLGLTEESDAVAVVVSEETGAISICHRRRIERDFTPETFRKRIGEILLQSSYDEETDSEKLAGEDHLTPPRDHALVSDQKERGNDPIAV